MGIGALLVYFGPRGTIGSLLVTFGYPAIVGIFPAVFLGMYWRGATSTGAVVSTILGVGIVLLQTVFGVVPTLGIYPGGWAFLVGIVSMVVVSLVGSATADQEMLAGYDL
jgi:Na+/proline symporter